ncbi:hypothetical protein QNA08_00330 [Chelatococcus sp. SYSU_G07232]|uniref:Hedgehog/Intein (Hint) domain-containing protein n=1 Tax=Chelatococcus albus TaxID=3047466 RepID=A0ABT7ABF2_9HYPH|nr:hypothetical protein [Chelatococcus sp. SYSU_G07232]MDJ1156695.1 hypothetical protein [Chelatococcus sp. SYSU_G07232]
MSLGDLPRSQLQFPPGLASMQGKHSLFEHYPIDGQVVVAGEALTTPYHIYDGTMCLIGGTVLADAALDLLSREGLTPVLDDGGRALAAVWVCDFTEANLGPHHELQISLFAASRPIRPLKAHPFAILRAFTTVPEARMVCHGLWNSTERVVRYNSEHLCLNAAFSASEVRRGDGQMAFHFPDTAGNLIAEGTIRIARGQSMSVIWQVVRHLGIGTMIRSARSPYIHIPVVNTRGAFSKKNLISDTYSQGEKQLIRRFDSRDRLIIGHPVYAPLDFKPDFVQQIDGVGFVYLRPQPWSD